jgi:hypothetical protein
LGTNQRTRDKRTFRIARFSFVDRNDRRVLRDAIHSRLPGQHCDMRRCMRKFGS